MVGLGGDFDAMVAQGSGYLGGNAIEDSAVGGEETADDQVNEDEVDDDEPEEDDEETQSEENKDDDLDIWGMKNKMPDDLREPGTG